jgi:hypothetical protein
MTQCGGAQPAMAAVSARRMSRADRDRKRPTASPETARLSQAQGEGHNAAWRCATCDSSSRTSQRPSAWIVKVVRIVRVMAGFARAEAEVAELAGGFLLPQAATNQRHRPRRRRQQLKHINL